MMTTKCVNGGKYGASGLTDAAGAHTALVCMVHIPPEHTRTVLGRVTFVTWKSRGCGNLANSAPGLAKTAVLQSKPSGRYVMGRLPSGRSLAFFGSVFGF